MADYTIGTAFVQIAATTKGVIEDLAKQGAQWGTNTGKSFASSFNDQVKKDTGNAPLGPSTDQSTQQGSKSAGAFGDAFKARLKAAMDDLPDAKITADSSDADRAIADIRAQLAELHDAKIGIDISEDDALAKVAGLKAELDALGASSTSVKVQFDTSSASAAITDLESQLAKVGNGGGNSGGKWAQDFDKAVTSALADLPDVKIDADSTDADRKLADIRAELLTLKGQTVGVDISDDEALAKIAVLKASLIALGKSSPDVNVKVDAAGAASELASITGASAAATDSLKSLGSVAGESSADIGLMGPAAGAAVVALVPLAGLAGGALAALPGIFTGIAGGVGVLAIGLGGVSGAVKAYEQEQSKAATTTTSSAQAQEQAAASALSAAETQRNAAQAVQSAQQGLGNAVTQSAQDQQDAQERLGNAEQAVADARTQAADQVRQAAEQLQQAEEGVNQAAQGAANAQQALSNAVTQAAASVSQAQEQEANAARSLVDANQALTNAQVQASQQQHQAEEQVTSSEQALATAQRSETTAQQALTQARIDAENQLTNYNDQLKQGKLDATSDALAIQQAQADLVSTVANPASTQLQIAQAQLAVQEAQQAAQTQADQYAQLQQTAAQAAKAGVDGSTQVVGAQQQVTDATQSTANAQQSLADAQAAQTQAQITGQQQIASAIEQQQAAEQALTDATTAVTTAQVQGAQQVASAQQAVANAQQAQADAQQALSDATLNNSQAQATAAENVQKAVQALGDTQTANSRQAAADAQAEANAHDQVTQAILNQQAAAAQALGAAQPSGNPTSSSSGPDDFQKASPAVQGLAKYIAGTLTPEWDKFKSDIQAALIPGVTKGLEDLQPLIKPLDGFMTGMAKGAGDFFTNLGKTLSTKSSINDLTKILGSGAGFMKDMGKAVTDVTPGFLTMSAKASPIVAGIGKGVDGIAKSFGKWLNGNGFQNFLNWLQANGPALVTSFEEMATFMADFIIAVAPAGVALDETLGFLVSLPGAAAGLVNALFPTLGFFSAWQAAWGGISTAASTMWAAVDLVFQDISGFFTNTLPGAITTGVGFFIALPGRIVTAVGDIVGTAFGALLTVGTWLETNVWPLLYDWYVKIPTRAATAIGDFLGVAFADLTGAAVWLVNNLWNGTGNAAGFFTGLAGRAYIALTGFFGTAFKDLLGASNWFFNNVWLGAGDISGFFVRLPGKVAGTVGKDGTIFWDAALSDLEKVGSWLDNNLLPAFKAFFTGLPAAISGWGIWDDIGSDFTGGINDVIGTINTKFIGSFQTLLDDLKIPLKLPTITPLATGGVMGSGVGAGFVTAGPRAIVGEGDPRHPEAVIATDPRYRANSLRLFGWAGKKLGVPGFEEGGILPAIMPQGGPASWVSKGLSDIGGVGLSLLSGAAGLAGDVTSFAVNAAFDNILAPPVDAAAGALPGMLGEITKGVIDQFLGDLEDFLDGKASSFSDGPNASGFGGYGSLTSWLGVPYTWGGGHAQGETPTQARIAGVDCSGLVDMVYGLNGITTDQFNMGSPVGFGDSGPGDLIFFNTGEGAQPGHVGIITAPGGSEMIDAPNSNSVVRRDKMDASGGGFGPIMGVRRFPPSVTGIGFASDPSAAPATGGGDGSPGSIQALAQGMAAARGWTGAEWTALNDVEMAEAGWNLTAQNPTSSAYGIAQFINGAGEYAQYGGDSTSAVGQITAFFNYIAQRYGDPEAAWAHEQAFHWYATGGIFNGGPRVIGVGEAGPEAVVTPKQLWDFVQTVTPAAAAGPTDLAGLAGAGQAGHTGPVFTVAEQHFHDQADIKMLMNTADFAFSQFGR